MTEKEITTLSTVRKIAMILAVVVGIVAVTVTLFNAFDLWGKFRDIETIRSWVESAGPYGILVYGALVFAQVLILPIPSTVTNFVAILLFEPWVTFLVTTIVTIVGSYVCFLIGRIFGKRLVSWLIGKDKTEKYADLLQKKGKVLFVTMLVLPAFPDDVLCMVAGLSTMSWPFFTIAILLARPVMIAIVSFVGRAALDAIDTWGIPVAIGVILLILIAVILVMFRRDRKAKKENAQLGPVSDERKPKDKSDNPDEK